MTMDQIEGERIAATTPQKRPLPPSPQSDVLVGAMASRLQPKDYVASSSEGQQALQPDGNGYDHLQSNDQQDQLFDIRVGKPAKKGLNNLGNTCFMNSALQCLSATVPLSSYFLSGRWEEEVNSTNPLGMQGIIPKTYAHLIDNLWNNDGSTSFAPRDFKYMIGERNPTFVGYGQQDSHELLQSLLDGLHEDLNRIKKKEYVEDPDYEPGKMTEQEFADISWNSYKKRNDSIIVDLFQAQLKSRTECRKCQRVSIKFDPYMYLQLPIPEPKTINVTVYLLPFLGLVKEHLWNKEKEKSRDEAAPSNGNLFVEASRYEDRSKTVLDALEYLKPQKVVVTVPRNATILDVKKNLLNQLLISDVEESEWPIVHCFEVWAHKLFKGFDDTDLASSIGTNDVVYFAVSDNLESLKQDSRISPFINEKEMDQVLDADPMISYHNRPEPSSYHSYYGIKSRKPTTKSPIQAVYARFITDTREAFGTPLALSLPKVFFFNSPMTQKQAGFLIGDIIYTMAVENLARFTQRPLFRRVGSGITLEMIRDHVEQNGWGFYSNDLSYFAVSSEWEPLPNLFSLQIGETGPSLYPRTTSSHSEQEDGPPNRTESSGLVIDELTSANGPVSSPRSELSELASNVERQSIGVDEPSFRLPSSRLPAVSNLITHYTLPGETLELLMIWVKDNAKEIFGESVLDGIYNRHSRSVFDPNEETVSEEKSEKEPSKTITLNQCMAEFTKEELLDGDDNMYCSRCKEHQPTLKTLSVYSLPEILVIQLKRFSNSGRSAYSSRSKLDDFVDAPEELDMSTLISTHEASDDCLYDLFSVSNHFGGLGGGHYTAYTKSFLDGNWYNCDDSHVSIATGNIVTPAAYLLFYKKRSSSKTQITVEQLLPIISNANQRLRRQIHEKQLERQTERDELNVRPERPFAHQLLSRSQEVVWENPQNSNGSTNVSSPTATISNETAAEPDSVQESGHPVELDEIMYEGDQPITEYP